MGTFLDALGIHYEPSVLTVIGVLIALSFLGSKVFQRFGIPQVVGFIVMGVVLGTSFLNIVPLELAEELTFVSQIALGLIGFDMGSHLRLRELRRLGRSIAFILLFEAVGSFALVAAGTYWITGSWSTALVFGAISSATAPAATVDVLAEYDAQGPLTTTLLAVIGLDDAFSLLLYSLAAAVAEAFLQGEGPSLLQMVQMPLVEVGGSLILGLLLGLTLEYILCHMKRQHDAMAISISFVFLCVGLSEALGFSLILSTMIMGGTVINRCAEHGRHIRFTIEQAGPVIYVLFFTLVGAHFQISLLPQMGMLGIVYVVLRSTGKFGGAWLGGTVGQAPPTVRNNLGLGLLTQGGVAIGLALASARRFSSYGEAGAALGFLVLNVITATTLIVEIIGPICVKLAIRRAGEIGQASKTDEPWASEGAPE